MASVLIITGLIFEDIGLFYLFYKLKEAGHDVVVASFLEKLKGIYGTEVKSDIQLDVLKPEKYDALFLPGGLVTENLRLMN